jgi:hypothetical protein
MIIESFSGLENAEARGIFHDVDVVEDAGYGSGGDARASGDGVEIFQVSGFRAHECGLRPKRAACVRASAAFPASDEL